MRRKAWFRIFAGMVLYGGVLVVTSAVGGLSYFHFANPRNTCASCHEMTGVHSDWSASTHRTVHCRNCHGGALTLDVHALESHLNRVVQHFTGDLSRPLQLKEKHVLGLHDSCRACHPQAYADWQSSRHSTTYARIFLDPAHNRTEPPTNDCLRCHGMFAAGDIANLVVPPTAKTPWALKDPAKADQPALPCLACHQVHARAGETQKANLYDRREQTHFSAERLPVSAIFQGERAVKVSRDPRQRLCTQCHAPDATRQLGTSDDRTPAGVHEGLSCRDCHWSHNNSAKSSCAACHPADSHCGLDVTKMDTTFLSPTSKHNVHTVACADCHTAGVPKGLRGKN
ncbi:MAG: cytochrome c3 family protein [Verrucomicrobia bacterium]|nr:cytochrome c3 family protein [Verrucomicrobiota bacterium]